jgi:hypothetical protein
LSNAAALLARAESVASKHGVPQWRALMLVLADELSEVAVSMPKDARVAFEGARLYWSERLENPQILLDLKKRCWAYLDSIGAPTEERGAEVRLTRAVLCLLEPEGDDEDAGDTAEWFAAMLWPG